MIKWLRQLLCWHHWLYKADKPEWPDRYTKVYVECRKCLKQSNGIWVR